MSSSNHHSRSASLVRSLVCALTVLAVASASCSSMHKVPVVAAPAGQPMAWQVKAGDTIRVTMRDGGSSVFSVQSVTPDAIVAINGARFEQTNITSVERRGFSLGKTLGLGAVGAVAAYYILLYAAFSSLVGGSPN
jgi:hypothetical protein